MEKTETKINLHIEDDLLALNAVVDHRGLDLLGKVLTEVRSFMAPSPPETPANG